MTSQIKAEISCEGEIHNERMAGYIYARFRVSDNQEIRLADIIILILEGKPEPECPIGRIFFPAVSPIGDFIRNELPISIHKAYQICGFLDSISNRFRLNEIQRCNEIGNLTNGVNETDLYRPHISLAPFHVDLNDRDQHFLRRRATVYIILAAAAPRLEYTGPNGERNYPAVLVSQQVAEIQVLHTVFPDAFLRNDVTPFHNIIMMDVADFIRFLHLISLVNEPVVGRHDEMMCISTVMDFFDEIQEVKDWEKCINSLRVSLDCDIYITGSNAKLLSGELATYLGGRYVEFVIYPFSFGEFMELYRSIAPDAPIQQCFQKYLLAGGMPYLANLRYADAPSKQYLHDLFNSVQLKNIVKRNKIRDVDLLERIIAYVIANVGTTFSATSLAKFLKNEQRTVAPETILNYIKYCCEAYLFYQVKREDL